MAVAWLPNVCSTMLSGVAGGADAHCSSGSAGRALPDHPVTIFPARWRWTAAGYSLRSPARCAHGHRLGARQVLVGWNNSVPNPCLTWTCRACGHITWAKDPDPSRQDQTGTPVEEVRG